MKNNNNIILAKYHSILFWGISFVLFLPVILIPPQFQPSDWTRTILFRIVFTGLIIVFLYKYFLKKEPLPLPKIKNPVFLPLAVLFIFVFFVFLSLIFSQDIRFSFFGSPPRSGGFLNLLFFVIFAALLPYLISGDKWKKIFNVLFAAGILISLLAVVQYFNIFGKIFLSYEGGGTPSFLGNSTFLAIYMLFLTFFAFTLFVQEKDKNKKLLNLGLFCLFGFTILISGSRAAYLGLLVSFIFYLLLYPKKIKILKILTACILLSAVFIVIIFNLFPQIAEKNSLFSMMANRLSIKKINQDLAGTRLAAWQITMKAIQDKPLLGWGPENFYIGFEKYFDPVPSNLQKLWWDRPHNVFLEIWASSGIFALIFYIAFWLALLWQLQKLKARQSMPIMAHGLQAMFIGYLAVLFFNFDNFSTYLISFFFIGYSFFLLFNQTEEHRITFLPPQKHILQKKPIAIFIMALVFLFLWFWNIKPLYLNEKIAYISNLASSKNCQQALKLADNENWDKAGILKSYASLKYADVVLKCASAYPDKEIFYSKKALSFLKTASKYQPNWSRTWLFMGSLTNIVAAKENDLEGQKKLLAEARGYLETGIKLSPKRQEFLTEMEKNEILAKDYQAMKKTAEDCINIDSNQAVCYWYLGVAEIFLGDQINGKKHIEEALEKKQFIPSYIHLGVAYLSQKNYKDAAEAYRLAIAYNDAKNASWHAVLAFLYKQIGEYGKAANSALEVFKLQPENKDAIEFLRQLTGVAPNDPSIHISLAYIYTQMGNTEKAKQEYLILKSYYLQEVARKPLSAKYHFSLASVYKELQDYNNAIEQALLTEKLDPEYHIHVINFLNSLPDKKYYDEYIKNLTKKK